MCKCTRCGKSCPHDSYHPQTPSGAADNALSCGKRYRRAVWLVILAGVFLLAAVAIGGPDFVLDLLRLHARQ
jgi:hypothetical protein